MTRSGQVRSARSMCPKGWYFSIGMPLDRWVVGEVLAGEVLAGAVSTGDVLVECSTDCSFCCPGGCRGLGLYRRGPDRRTADSAAREAGPDLEGLAAATKKERQHHRCPA